MSERRDSQGRWIAGGAGLGAAGGAAAGLLVGRSLVRRSLAVHDAAIADTLLPDAERLTEQHGQAQMARINRARDIRLKSMERGFKVAAETERRGAAIGPVTRYVRMLRQHLLRQQNAHDRADAAINQHLSVIDAGGQPPLDFHQFEIARQRRDDARAAMGDLREGIAEVLAARPDGKVSRKSATAWRRSRGWTYERKVKGAHGLTEHRRVSAEPKVGLAWLQPATTVRRAGDIPKAALGEMRSALAQDTEARVQRLGDAVAARLPRVEGRILSGLVDDARISLLAHAARLRVVPRVGLVGGLLAGAAAGGGAGYAVHQLGKAAPESNGDDVLKVGDAASNAMADRLATVFRGWKDDATHDLLSARSGALSSSILTGLDYATRPISIGFRGGMNVPVLAEQESGEPRKLLFTFQARGSAVERYIEEFRQSKITALAGEQQEAIKAELLQAAREGQGPDVMARRIREIIGLTPNQAAAVQSFRAQLDRLDPRVMQRALRDKRYDKTITAAMESKEKLSNEQVTRMVDAYHRRALAARAMMIARTEGVGAANNGHILAVTVAAEQNPEMTVAKTWMATDDEKTRHDHRELHGKTVFGLETPFVCDSGDEIRWPHDPSAAAKQVIHCRCTVLCRLVPTKLAARRGPDSVPQLRPIKGRMNA